MRPRRLTISIAFFSMVLVFMTFPSATEGQATVVEILQDEENQVTLHSPSMNLWKDGKWMDLETVRGEGEFPTLKKNDRLRFQATVINRNKTDIELESFSTFIYNASGEITQSFVKLYKTSCPIAIILSQNSTKTDISEGRLDLDERGTYSIQIRFIYRINSLTLSTKSENVTFLIEEQERTPPDVILWIWMGITAIITGVVLVGVYGKIQLRRIAKKTDS